MKKRTYILVSVIILAGMIVAGASNLTLEQIFNSAYDSTTNTLQVSVSTGTNKDTTALTNSATYPLELQHETSGTPAAGIGVGLEFIQETFASNNETGAYIEAVVTDATAGSEDFEVNIGTMAAGATAAEVLSISSVGVVTLDGGATLDNSTSATELAIAETNIQLTGVTDLEGGAVTVNDDSGDYDFTVESNGNAAAIKVDAGNDRVGIFTAAPTVAFDITGETNIAGDFDVDTDVLTVDSTNDIVEINGWYDMPYQNITTTPYSITSTGKASYFVVNYTDTGAASVVLDTDLTVDGRVIVIKDGELNANTNNITIGTEGAETIDEAATYAMDADGEAVTLLSDGTNWFIMNAYGE